ncbi:putative bifunctional diguanylate cyclase/phosphodiesterase [Butyrivibrio sp. VCD2006]|uniref:putative bifunctional diguanylate cyclase/phosphodiesterase n=1 Tax=Butyrivibrio sp. VCD2006 TaxID=1280664 RepID=UPI0004093B1A|nr:GGDEF domain-containing phosphodiesterase [Butyrivibrio sp. VCD2006]
MDNNILDKFVQILSATENTMEAAYNAFSLFALDLGISRITLDMNIPETRQTPTGEVRHITVYQGEMLSDEEPEIVWLEESQHTFENGTITAHVYGSVETNWSPDERQLILSAIRIFLMHVGRFRLVELVQKSALTQYLTGLPNSGGFLSFATQKIIAGEITKYNSYYFNLKGFGLINRRFGTDETDNIIRRYARTLLEFCKEDEVIGHLGGDNFVALIRKERTGDFLNLLQKTPVFGIRDGEKIPITISAIAGVYDIDESLKNPGQILGRSSIALSVARSLANEPFLFVTKEMSTRVYREKQIEDRFEDGLSNNEFKVFYQPKVDTKTHTLIGAEALSRWLFKGEYVYPSEFVPVLERNSYSIGLDIYVIEEVCRTLRRWLDMGLDPVPISVNFSRSDLTDERLADQILEIITKYGIDLSYIQIEVTETATQREKSLITNFLNKLDGMNIASSIDDFGTGYSSLGILRDLPVSTIKIDKSFIENDVLTHRDEVVLRNIINMAKELDIEVITEGVERTDQIEFLQRVGCDLVQGFFYDKPLELSEFEERLKNKTYDV